MKHKPTDRTMKGKLLWMTFAVIIFGMLPACARGVHVVSLKTEMRVNPVGIDNPAPMLSWQLASDRNDVSQQSYRILVASSLRNLSDDVGDLWDSGEVRSSQTLYIPYGGRPLEGVIYKPANFDPNKKYPMIVNFYERNSETLYEYHMPEPHRSTIDYRLYNSNGYIVFNPDIRYRDGYPGESCYNCLMPGVSMMIAKGYIDEKAIGAQGHSWGGYQVAYLATRTNLFAAIESGAPVVNMFSAYGGIRWGSGMARAFQYEHTQSRLGGTPWSTPDRYHTNSPLFTMDKVQTPILIMHNDADGHVPWYQGIEYFVAMKRLGKPCWLLNYTGEPHWPLRMANRIDFQTRMFQFFNHFLKHEAAPKWLDEGVRAVDQPYELGY